LRPEPLRQALTAISPETGGARHRFWPAAIALVAEEGIPIGELGREWGISRQIAARYAKEAQGGSG